MDKLIVPRIGVPKVTLPKVCLAERTDKDNVEETYITDGLVFHLDDMDKGPTEGKWTDLVGGVVYSASTSSYDGKWNASFSGNGFDQSACTIEVVFDNATDIEGDITYFSTMNVGSIACGLKSNYLALATYSYDGKCCEANLLRKQVVHAVSATMGYALADGEKILPTVSGGICTPIHIIPESCSLAANPRTLRPCASTTDF